MHTILRHLFFCLTLISFFSGADAWAAKSVDVVIEDPFIEFHTGPGRGYPIFHVIEEGESVSIIRRRTNWFEVESDRGVKGWVSREQLEQTIDTDGNTIRAEFADFDSFSNRRLELGFMSGDFGGSDMLSVNLSYQISPNLFTELTVAQGIGSFSDSLLATASIGHQFFPTKRITPYFSLGAGAIRTSPNATLVETEDRNDQMAFVGAGLRTYVTQRLVIRTEYNSYVIFTSRDDNQEVDEWKFGFSFFF